MREYEEYLKKKNNGDIIVITKDLVNEMRNMGKYDEANEVIRTQQKMIITAKKEELRIIKNNDQKIMRFHKKKLNLCVSCSEPLKDKKYTKCFCCRKRDRGYNKKYKEKRDKNDS